MSLPQPAGDDTVLITGASSGIGAELARRLADRGHGVTLVARRRERLQELAEELRAERGARAEMQPCDLADARARSRLIARVREGGATVVGVCNNAGYGSYGKFQRQPLEREQEMVRLNVEALHELSGAFLAPMIDRGAGAILNVASIAAFQPTAGFATYAGTKAFVQTFSESLSADLAGTGVSCTVVCPGPVPTEFSDVAGTTSFERLMPGFMSVSPEDVAKQAVDGMVAGRRSVVPGMPVKAIAAAGRYVPRTLLLPLTRRGGGARLDG
jgi:short-subunit dehydrogenase